MTPALKSAFEAILAFNDQSLGSLTNAIVSGSTAFSSPLNQSSDEDPTKGQTLLHAAINLNAGDDALKQKIRTDIINYLITQINNEKKWARHPFRMTDNEGDTPLHSALKLPAPDTITANQLLDTKQIDLTAKNKAGQTAYDIALAKAPGQQVSEELLERLKTQEVLAKESAITPVLTNTLKYDDKSQPLLAKAMGINPSLPKEESEGQALLSAMLAKKGSSAGEEANRLNLIQYLIAEIKKSSLWYPHPLTKVDKDGNIPLHVAIKNKEIEVVKALLLPDANGLFYGVNEKDKEGNTPLHIAISLNAWSIVRLLVETKKADLSLKDGQGREAFALLDAEHSIPEGEEYSQLGDQLKSEGVKKAESEEEKKRKASTYSFDAVLRKLLDCDETAFDLLKTAMPETTTTTYSLLNQVNVDRQTLLHLAIKLNVGDDVEKQRVRKEVIAHLITEIKKEKKWVFHPFNMVDKDGDTPLHAAIKAKDQLTIDALLAPNPDSLIKIDLTIKDKDGHTPLHLAIEAGNVALVEQLLKAGKCDLTSLYKSGDTHLHTAIRKDLWAIVKLLVDYQFNVDLKGTNDNVSAYYLIAQGHSVPEEYAGLLERLKSSDVKAKELADNKEQEAKERAEKQKRETEERSFPTVLGKLKDCNEGSFFALKEALGEKYNNYELLRQSDPEKGTLLHAAIALPIEDKTKVIRAQIITYLIEGIRATTWLRNHPLSAIDAKGNTPLHLAIINKDSETVTTEFVKKEQVDLTVQNLKGETALHLAIKNNDPAMVAELLSAGKANLSLVNDQQETAYALAIRLELEDMNGLLESLKPDEVKAAEKKTKDGNELPISTTSLLTNFNGYFTGNLTSDNANASNGNGERSGYFAGSGALLDTLAAKASTYMYRETSVAPEHKGSASNSHGSTSSQSAFPSSMISSVTSATSLTSSSETTHSRNREELNDARSVVAAIKFNTESAQNGVVSQEQPTKKRELSPEVIAAITAIEELGKPPSDVRQLDKDLLYFLGYVNAIIESQSTQNANINDDLNLFKQNLLLLKDNEENLKPVSSDEVTLIVSTFNKLSPSLQEVIKPKLTVLAEEFKWVALQEDLTKPKPLNFNTTSIMLLAKATSNESANTKEQEIIQHILELRSVLISIHTQFETSSAGNVPDVISLNLIQIANAASTLIDALKNDKITDKLEALQAFNKLAIPSILALEGQGSWNSSFTNVFRRLVLAVLNFWYGNEIEEAPSQAISTNAPTTSSATSQLLITGIDIAHACSLSSWRKEIDNSMKVYVPPAVLSG